MELRELREEFSDEAGRVRVEAVLYGFQVDKEMVGIMLLRIFLLGIAGKCRHAWRDSVTQARHEAISAAGRVRGFYCSLSRRRAQGVSCQAFVDSLRDWRSRPCTSLRCLSNICCMSWRFSAMSPTRTKVTFGQIEQVPFRKGSPLGTGLIDNSAFFMLLRSLRIETRTTESSYFRN